MATDRYLDKKQMIREADKDRHKAVIQTGI